LLCRDINGSTTAPEMFTQIDVLSLPGAGLRHLDFPQQVSSMFQSYYAGDTDPAHVPLELMPSPLTGAQCYVRTYGSEPEMYVQIASMARVESLLIKSTD
jgi:hypothetical protein